MENSIAIVLGNDHTNTLGVVQALGIEDIKVYAVLWGSKTGIVASSKLTYEIIYCDDSFQCISRLLMMDFPNGTVIIPCCDEAAVVLEKNIDVLQDRYEFQKAKKLSILALSNKNEQIRLADECGLKIPRSVIVDSDGFDYKDVIFPCIIKPVVSTEGSTSDIIVCDNIEALKDNINRILPKTKRLLVQEYIQKKSDCGLLGCSFKNGEVMLPCLIDRPRIYPPKTGLGTIYVLDVLKDEKLRNGITSFIKKMGYVGLFSFEFAIDNNGNYYFIEANFRNDGENPCLVKSGINIIYQHYCDMINKPYRQGKINRKYTTISELRHMRSFIHGDISFFCWVSDILHADSFMTYYKEDPKPLRYLIKNQVAGKIKSICAFREKRE